MINKTMKTSDNILEEFKSYMAFVGYWVQLGICYCFHDTFAPIAFSCSNCKKRSYIKQDLGTKRKCRTSYVISVDWRLVEITNNYNHSIMING